MNYTRSLHNGSVEPNAAQQGNILQWSSLFLTNFRKKLFKERLWNRIFWDTCNSFFFLKFLEDMSPFCGATDTPVLDFWWRLPWVSKPGWIPRFHASLPVHNGFLRFTSGAIPADLLAASMAAGHIPYMLHM